MAPVDEPLSIPKDARRREKFKQMMLGSDTDLSKKTSKLRQKAKKAKDEKDLNVDFSNLRISKEPTDSDPISSLLQLKETKTVPTTTLLQQYKTNSHVKELVDGKD